MNDRLEVLKAQADQLGISYKANIGEEALYAKIQAKLAATDDKTDTDGDGLPDAAEKPGAVRKLTRAEQEQKIRDKQMAEQMALVRVRITNLNPMKTQVPGEFITVANKYVGTVRKFIPFGEATENGYHVPRILLDELKSRQFNMVKTTRGKNPGEVIRTERLVKEFAIEELEPLTSAELAQLAAQQMAAAGL